MTEYILFIHSNTTSEPAPEAWDRFFNAAQLGGMFIGGSAVSPGTLLGNTSAPASTHIGGYMRFATDDRAALLRLLETHHPVLLHGGTVELCETPRT
ncbi:hypothetical protein DB346_22405 [Verrucomicrobia bacterium LW23]|nr:hypothetical protein DB346_22405 [Verrucomicrobia bacterium LW23]